MSIVVTTLIENNLSHHTGLECEHGLSFHVRTPSRSFLLDCGASPAFVRNAAKLNIDLSRLDFVAGSHSHYDHGGGFRALVASAGSPGRFIAGEGYFHPKYAVDGARHSFIGVDFDEAFLAERNIENVVCSAVLDVGDGCRLVGDFARTTPWERPGAHFRVLRDGEFQPDLFNEEICLTVPFADGVAILSGCAHPGIVNIAETVRSRLGLPVRAVWGGTHLMAADRERIALTVAALKALGVKRMGLSHCSGETARETIGADADIEVCDLRTGDGLVL